MNNICIILLYIILNLYNCYIKCESLIDIPNPPVCTNNINTHKFDISSLQCIDCGSSLSPPQVPSTDKRSCKCSNGYRNNYINNNIDEFVCVDCVVSNQVASRDGSKCISCNATYGAVLNTVTRECDCPTGYALTELNEKGDLLNSKQCVKCPSYGRVFPSEDPYTCLLCPDINMIMQPNKQCSCDTGYSTIGQSCVLTSYASTKSNEIDLAKKVTFYDVQSSDRSSTEIITFTSATFNDLFLAVLHKCEVLRIREACQSLANLCVLVKYESNHQTCKSFYLIHASIASFHSGGFQEWKLALPWLKYDGISVLSSTILTSQMSLFSQTDTTRTVVSNLKFMLAKYALNGTYLGLEDLKMQLQLCGGDSIKNLAYQRFATNFENSCDFHLYSLISNNQEQYFYDLYIVDINSKLFPLPVKVLNYREGTSKVNVDSSSPVLHRRFFLYDTKTSADVLVYARSIQIDIQMRNNKLIFPPLVTIEYGERKISVISETKTNSASTSYVSFIVKYKKDANTFWTWVTVLFALSLVWIVLVWIHQYYIWQRINEVQQVDCGFLIRICIWILAATSNTLFWLAFILSGYVFIFFKGQQTASYLLPDEAGTEVTALKTVVTIAFVGKLLDVLYKLWNQIHVDLFFVDWEEPKDKNNKKSMMINEMNPINKNSNSGENNTNKSTNNDNVSAWRKLFVTNEWNELQSARLVNIGLSMFLLLFFLRGVDLEYLATAQPVMSNLEADSAPMHPILRFAINSFFLLLVIMIQILFRSQLYHRYVEDKAAQFADLLAFTNISCFIFDSRYRLSYIHGKTVHSHADVSLAEMNRQIASEQRNWTKPRGLVNGKDVFDIYVSRQFRAHYDRHMSTLGRELRKRQGDSRSSNNNNMVNNNNTTNNNRLSDNTNHHSLFVNEHLIESSNSLNDFLMSFIQKTSSYRWKLKEATPWMKLFSLPPAFIDDPSVSVVYADDNYSFTRNTLMGIEYDLTIFLILLYAVCDFASKNNTFVNILIVYIVDKLIIFIRERWGQKNVSLKTLVDDRFLI